MRTIKYTYIGTEVTGINRGPIEDESFGNATPQEFIHGYTPSYYTMVNGVLTPITQEEKNIFDDEQILWRRKLSKRAEIKEAFEVASVQNVMVGTTTFFGGKESAHDLKGSYDLIQLNGLTSMSIVDITSNKQEYSLPEALEIISAIAMEYQDTLFKKHEKYLEVEEALTLEEVSAVTWE